MKKTISATIGILAAATLMFAATPAMARVDIGVNVGIPAPVYYSPQPVYVQPRPVYVQARPVYYAPQPYYVDRHHHKHKKHHQLRDNDRDGVPNRYDRNPNNPYRY